MLNEPGMCRGVRKIRLTGIYNAARDDGYSVADGTSIVVAADGLHKRDVFSK